MVTDVLKHLRRDADGIFSREFVTHGQEDEIRLRQAVASAAYRDYLQEVCRYHSVPVMDREVRLFLRRIPEGGCVLDVGGCWGWQWRAAHRIRPDVCVCILDFVRANLLHARSLLARQLDRTIFLIHADALSLPFDACVFDGYWSVQALQHIPDFSLAVAEALRVLKPGGAFATYSLNRRDWLALIYALAGKRYHTQGYIPGAFYLALGSSSQRRIIERIFSNHVAQRYSEVLFHPQVRLRFAGKEGSLAGAIDSRLSSGFWPLSLLARQRSFCTYKPASRQR